MKTPPLALLLLVAGASLAGAQQPRRNPPAPAGEQPVITERELAVSAYSLRRQGALKAAAAAFDQLLEVMPKGPEKRLVGHETAELYRVMGRLDRALQLYRNNHDYAGEFEVLFLLNRVQEALTVARLVKYPKGEADALAELGRVDEAVRIYEEKGLRREKADALARAGRWSEAAAAYAAAGDFYSQGLALDAARDATNARRAYEDARMAMADELRNEWLRKVNKARQVVTAAPDAITRERARMRLAKVLGDVSLAYDKLAYVFFRTEQPQQQTLALATNARRFCEEQRDALLDTASGKEDAYGREAVKHLRLEERIAALDQQARDYGQGRPPGTPPGALRRSGR